MKGAKKLKKQILIWALLLIFVGMSIPGLAERWQTESANKTYETIVSYEEVYHLTGATNLDDALMELKQAGVTTINIKPLTIQRMENQNILSILTPSELYDTMLLFSNQKEDFNIDRKGFYITVPTNDTYKELLQNNIDFELITIENTPFYFLPAEEEESLNVFLGFDSPALANIEKSGFNIILQVENTEDEQINERIVDELLTIKNDHIKGLILTDNEALGYPNMDTVHLFTKQLNDAGYYFYSVEFTSIGKFKKVAEATDYNIVRLHSLNLFQNTTEQNIDRAIRAIKERNIRSIYFHLDDEKPTESFETAVDFVKGVDDRISDHFTSGSPSFFNQMTLPLWTLLASLAAGILFTYLASELLKYKLLRLVAVLLMVGLACAYLLFDKLIFLQAFALIIAIITPIFAVLHFVDRRKMDGNIRTITLQYLQAIGISIIGILILIGVLNGNAFFTGIEQFRGVKLVYVVPLAFVTVYLLWNLVIPTVKKHGFRLLNAEVRYWHLLVFVIVAGAGVYYVLRSGNVGSRFVSAFEINFRVWLEDVLYVRPRTKEFLIGFPAFLLGLFLLDKSKWLGKLLLIGGTIGFLSIVNTFTHFHTPLSISVLRTVYSLTFGYIIGIVLIYIVNFIYNKFKKTAV